MVEVYLNYVVYDVVGDCLNLGRFVNFVILRQFAHSLQQKLDYVFRFGQEILNYSFLELIFGEYIFGFYYDSLNKHWDSVNYVDLLRLGTKIRIVNRVRCYQLNETFVYFLQRGNNFVGEKVFKGQDGEKLNCT